MSGEINNKNIFDGFLRITAVSAVNSCYKMRRGIGLGAIQKQKLEQGKYKDKGNEIQENQFEQMTKQLEVFKVNLEEFATKHKNEIRKNPEFRKQFQVFNKNAR